MKKKILLVEPAFPIPPKSRNHKNFLPIGLLKIASYLRSKGIEIKLVRGNFKNLIKENEIKKFNPNEIWITSLFTYWAQYVKDAVESYKSAFPKAKVLVGGPYASLMKKHCKQYTGCDEVVVGVIKKAERHFPAYELIENENPSHIDYQIIHTSRGCNRKCQFCGTWKIEPKFEAKKSIKKEIKSKKIVFYDNDFLCNPYIENILQELIDLKKYKNIQWCESQSGFGGRILLDKPHLAKMLKKAGFRYPRIAWDWEYDKYPFIEKQIETLINAGYRSKELYVFMLYNWKFSLEEMEKKRRKCWHWKVQIADCRYRPLNQTYDYYDPKKLQSNYDYFIHPNWTDKEVKQFRKNVRRQNICVRQEVSFYSRKLENKQLSKEQTRKLKRMKTVEVKKILYDAWLPEDLENEKKVNEIMADTGERIEIDLLLVK